MSENQLALLLDSFTMQEAVTLPKNFVTVFHTLNADFGLELPWPKPEVWVPRDVDGKEVGEEVIRAWDNMRCKSCGGMDIQNS